MKKGSSVAECLVYIKQYIYFLQNENILKIVLFPVIATIINVCIGKDIYKSFKTRETICFVIVCEVIWCGLFHSILNIVKEKSNIKRDNLAGVKSQSYFSSRAIVEFFVCAIQSLFFANSIYLICLYYDLDYIEEGCVFMNPTLEMYISILLIMYAADTLGLIISSLAASEIKASQLAPYVLIAELVFAGNLFDLDGVTGTISRLMVSRWGTEALGIALRIEPPEELKRLDYTFTTEHMYTIWAVIATYIIIQLIVGQIVLKESIKKVRI